MRFEALKVGELARRTGLTVRTLHHYDEIGLLRPSLHTEAGYRLYTARDVARLQGEAASSPVSSPICHCRPSIQNGSASFAASPSGKSNESSFFWMSGSIRVHVVIAMVPLVTGSSRDRSHRG